MLKFLLTLVEKTEGSIRVLCITWWLDRNGNAAVPSVPDRSSFSCVSQLHFVMFSCFGLYIFFGHVPSPGKLYRTDVAM